MSEKCYDFLAKVWTTFRWTILRVMDLFKEGDGQLLDNVFLVLEIKKERKVSSFLSKKSLFFWVFLFPEIPLEETGEGFSMPGLIASHFVDGVVDGVEIQLLGALSEGGLAGGGAVFGLDPHLQVLLGGVGEDLAQQLRELGGI